MKRGEELALPQGTLRDITRLYGFSVRAWGPVEGGYRNSSYSFETTDGRNLNFILYKREPGSADLIKRTNALGTYVKAQGLAVRAPVDERILRVGARYGSLYEYLEGTTIPWEAYTMKHIKLLGFALARFHDAAGDFEGALPDVETVYAEICQRMKRYFSEPGVTVALLKKRGVRVAIPAFRELLAQMKMLPNRSVLHMDFVRSNVLFKETGTGDVAVGSIALAGILDLEKAATGHVLFDIARTLAFLLVDCDKPTEKIYKYFLYSGYEKRGGGVFADDEQVHQLFCSSSLGSSCQLISPRCAGNAQPSQNSQSTCSSGLLEQLVTMFLTYDFYKFLRQNPYESLQKNHHFIRTEAILKARGVVQ